ncbi:MAG TPA: hypothetical protein PKE40_02040 [Arachnia sp.]|nr:hypothetical protein [Arachnia sp.]HMT85110.1 hypothetical protein [Arachnia sp.]
MSTSATGTCDATTTNSENAKMNLITQNDTMSSWAGNGACS